MSEVKKISVSKVNLHIHSTYSDGILKPKKILDIAMQNKLDLISITDHDTIEAYKQLQHKQYPLKILPGIEMSSSWKDEDVHILGYGIDIHNKDLSEILAWLKEGRRRRAEKIHKKLYELGINIPFESIVSYTGEKELIVRPHIAKALIAHDHCKTKQEAFDKYIGNDAPAYVAKPILSTPDVIKIIHESGGRAVVAHPGKLKSIVYVDDFVQAGLDGVEVWHPDHGFAMILELNEYCNFKKLLRTAGSDFHGANENTDVFYHVQIPEDAIEDIQLLCDEYKEMYQHD